MELDILSNSLKRYKTLKKVNLGMEIFKINVKSTNQLSRKLFKQMLKSHLKELL